MQLDSCCLGTLAPARTSLPESPGVRFPHVLPACKVTRCQDQCALSRLSRRILSTFSGILWTRARSASASPRSPESKVLIPLHWEAGGFYLYYSLHGQSSNKARDNRRIYAVADTGSPFLLVAKCLRKDCATYCAEVGCFEGEGQPSADPVTLEGYASGLVEVEWRSKGQISFPEATTEGSGVELSSLRFGVQGRVVGFGGTGKAVFFGLIRDHKPNIQASFLEQTPFKSLAIDLRYPGKETMELSTASILPTFEGDTLQRVKLVDPRRWGDPVKHYAALATLRVGGKAVTTKSSSGKVLVIFDTGTTGASLTTSLYDAYLRVARQSASSGMSWSQARQIEAVFDSGEPNVVFSMYRGKHPNYGLGLDLVTPMNEMTR